MVTGPVKVIEVKGLFEPSFLRNVRHKEEETVHGNVDVEVTKLQSESIKAHVNEQEYWWKYLSCKDNLISPYCHILRFEEAKAVQISLFKLYLNMLRNICT